MKHINGVTSIIAFIIVLILYFGMNPTSQDLTFVSLLCIINFLIYAHQDIKDHIDNK
jgi:hypothetical protein